jgi:hypothetical protein
MLHFAIAQAHASGMAADRSDAGGSNPSMEKAASSCGSGDAAPKCTLRRDLASLLSSASVSTGTCA